MAARELHPGEIYPGRHGAIRLKKSRARGTESLRWNFRIRAWPSRHDHLARASADPTQHGWSHHTSDTPTNATADALERVSKLPIPDEADTLAAGCGIFLRTLRPRSGCRGRRGFGESPIDAAGTGKNRGFETGRTFAMC